MNIPSNFTLDEIISVLNIPEVVVNGIDELQGENSCLMADNEELEDKVVELENVVDRYKELLDNIFRAMDDRTTYRELVNDIRELFDNSGVD